MLQHRNVITVFAYPLLALCFATTLHAGKALRIELNGKQRTILPLSYDQKSLIAVARSGSILDLKPEQLKNAAVVSKFRPFSQQEMRGQLLHEFGRAFQVSGTGNYLVVHPHGKRDLWADRFEELYRSMIHFFRTRGFPIGKPKYPLVGIVFASKQQYLQYSSKALQTNASNTYGIYLPTTNRIYLYDATRGRGTQSREWEENLATIMHEAAHQTAFNLGVHRRGAETPHWIAEGLGCHFECKGIYNAFQYRDLKDRINFGRLHSFQRRVQDDAVPVIQSIVASDDLFRRDPTRAYAAAWAMTFYLSEREPRKYMQYLKQVARRKPFTTYPAAARVQDFSKVFGRDYQMLAVRLVRFLQDLPETAGNTR